MAGSASDAFFWNDWQGDPLLKLCSMAAQGFWMRLLCICAEAKPKGYLLVNGRKPTVQELAIIASQSPSDVEIWLEDLDKNGVYSKNRAGVIYSRKMVRDEQKRRSSSKGGKIGGRVTHEKQIGIHATRTPTRDATRTPRRAPLPSPSPSPFPKEEERTSVSETPLAAPAPLDTHMTEAGFNQWWKACASNIPKRSSRPLALKQWLKLPQVAPELMIAAWDAYIAQNKADSERQRFAIATRQPADWFRLRIFENYLDDVRNKADAADRRKLELAKTFEQWNGHAHELAGRISMEKFQAIFTGSTLEERSDAIVITTKTEFEATRAKHDAVVMDALENLFPRRQIMFVSLQKRRAIA